MSDNRGIITFKKCRFLVCLVVLLFSCHSRKKTGTSGETYSSDSAHIRTVSEILQISEKKVREYPLFQFIASWYGVPYAYGSCSRSGIDCSCFVNLLYRQIFQLSLPRSSGEIFEKCRKISKDELKEGDLVFFNTSGKGSSHVGVYLRDDKFVHASTRKGVMISSLNEEYFSRSFCGACRKENIR